LGGEGRQAAERIWWLWSSSWTHYRKAAGGLEEMGISDLASLRSPRLFVLERLRKAALKIIFAG